MELMFNKLTRSEMLDFLLIQDVIPDKRLTLPEQVAQIFMFYDNNPPKITYPIVDLIIANNFSSDITLPDFDKLMIPGYVKYLGFITDGTVGYVTRYRDNNQIVIENDPNAIKTRNIYYEEVPLTISGKLSSMFAAIFGLNINDPNTGNRIFRILRFLNKIKITCICGSEVSWGARSNHWGDQSILPYEKYTIFPIKDLYLEAIVRDIDLNQSDFGICQDIHYQLPPINWFNQMLYWASNLPQDDKNIVNTYIGLDAYIGINESLRIHPTQKAPLNDIIKKAPPLPHDIIVFRIVKNFIPQIGIMKSYGYLSTSYSLIGMRDEINICIKNNTLKSRSLMRIKVPAGTQCIYSPYISELIFPHNINIAVYTNSLKTIPCKVLKDKSIKKSQILYQIDCEIIK